MDDRRFLRVTDDEGELITLTEALKRRDALIERAAQIPEPEPLTVTTIEAAKRIGRIQAQIVLMQRGVL